MRPQFQIIELAWKSSRARNPKSKPPGAGRRVKMDRRGKQGEEYLDTLPGDIQYRLELEIFEYVLLAGLR